MANFKLNKMSRLFFFLIIFLSTCSSSQIQPNPSVELATVATANNAPEVKTETALSTSIAATAEITPTQYLPLVNNLPQKFLGVYFQKYWTTQSVDEYLVKADQQTGNKISSIGWFIDLQDIAFTPRQNELHKNNFYRQLDALWKKGYVSFVNLGATSTPNEWISGDNCPLGFTLSQILNGECDRAIETMADLYYQWVSLGGGRRAMITIFQEMNGVWISYGKDPNTSDEYKLAYRYILDKFTTRGITRDQVWWVFAPNGYNDPGDDARKFENYYPGDDVVDIISFSSYNWGFCPDIQPPEWRSWEDFDKIFEPYIVRMREMAPAKPIMIAETATSPFYGQDENGIPYDPDFAYMNQWFIKNYEYLANREGVIGVYYFSYKKFGSFENCQIEVNPNEQMLSGFVSAASNPIYQRLNVDGLGDVIRNR